MSDHMRQQILAAVATAVTGLATTGANVFRGRVSDLQRSELPALRIRMGNEVVEPRTFPAPRTQERRLQVDVVACVREADGLDAALNAIFAEVEVALGKLRRE